MLRYRDLSRYEKKVLTNGCGGKGGFVNPPNFFFKASCDQHDFYYWRGGNWKDRLKADWQFYIVMIIDIKENISNNRLLKRLKFLFIATLYFFAVRWFGWRFFHYSKSKRTRKDIPKNLGV